MHASKSSTHTHQRSTTTIISCHNPFPRTHRAHYDRQPHVYPPRIRIRHLTPNMCQKRVCKEKIFTYTFTSLFFVTTKEGGTNSPPRGSEQLATTPLSTTYFFLPIAFCHLNSSHPTILHPTLVARIFTPPRLRRPPPTLTNSQLL